MEGSCFFQPVLHGIGYTAAYGAAGIDLVDRGVIQNPQGGEEAGTEGVYVRFLAIGQGVQPPIQGQLLLEAEHPVARGKVGMDVLGSLLPAPRYNDHRLCRSIMPVFHAGGLHHRVLVDLGSDGLVDHQIPQDLGQLLRGDAAGAQ